MEYEIGEEVIINEISPIMFISEDETWNRKFADKTATVSEVKGNHLRVLVLVEEGSAEEILLNKSRVRKV